MNPDTGAIGVFETAQDAHDAGFVLQLTPKQARYLLKMSRAERREWAKKAVRQDSLARIAAPTGAATKEVE